MTPFDIFRTFEVFKSVMAGTDVPHELKLQVAKEFKAALAPAQFSAQCKYTRQWLDETVQTKIDELQADADGKKEKGPDDSKGNTAGIGEKTKDQAKEDKGKAKGTQRKV